MQACPRAWPSWVFVTVRWARAGLACFVGTAILGGAAPARADLADDADRLARLWSQRGARVERLPPIFLDRGRARTIALAPALGREPGCLTVAFVAVRTAELLVGEDLGAPDPGSAPTPLPFLPRDAAPADRRLRSTGGAAVVVRCGADRSELSRARVELASPRAAVEILVARSDAPLAELREILPERAAGPTAARGDPGGPLEPSPLAERLVRASLRARGDGAVEVTRATKRALPSGAGSFELDLVAGCHRLDVMADLPTAGPRQSHRATDVDAEARDPTGKLLARDRADLPDARLDLCLGEAARITVPFAGAAGPVSVVLSDARWPAPARVPARWGARARGGHLGALFRRHAPDPPEPAIFESLGVQGTTSIPFEVQPGRCYLAALAMIRGEARSLRLSALLGDRVSRDDVNDRAEGVAVSFCAEDETVARLDVDARGNSAWWSLVVWPMGAASP